MNISFMCEALNYYGQRARFERYMVVINSHKMTVRNNIIYFDFGLITPFTKSKEFLNAMFYEGIIIGADRDKILQYYNSLVQSK